MRREGRDAGEAHGQALGGGQPRGGGGGGGGGGQRAAGFDALQEVAQEVQQERPERGGGLREVRPGVTRARLAWSLQFFKFFFVVAE